MASAQQANGFVVAEDDNLFTIQYRMITAALYFVLQLCQANVAFGIPKFAPDHTALMGGFHIKDLLHPQFRVNCAKHLRHAGTVRDRG
ncbi:hypothetical protein ACFMBG_05790 [Leisingera sp. D0M16]|uniref:hypothetical protein n=1 Tax=Leisingera coralii TaxID=3351347 RepID=UPI003B788A10